MLMAGGFLFVGYVPGLKAGVMVGQLLRSLFHQLTFNYGIVLITPLFLLYALCSFREGGRTSDFHLPTLWTFDFMDFRLIGFCPLAGRAFTFYSPVFIL